MTLPLEPSKAATFFAKLVVASPTVHHILGGVCLFVGAFFLRVAPGAMDALPLRSAAVAALIGALWLMRTRYKGTPGDGSDFRGLVPFLVSVGAGLLVSVGLLAFLVRHEVGSPTDYAPLVFLTNVSNAREHALIWLMLCLVFLCVEAMAYARWERSPVAAPKPRRCRPRARA